MPFEFRNNRTLLKKKGIKLDVCDLWQVDFSDRADTPMGRRYIVHNGETMIQASTLERAEAIMAEVLSGKRSLTPPPPRRTGRRKERVMVWRYWIRLNVICGWPILWLYDALLAAAGQDYRAQREQSNRALRNIWNGRDPYTGAGRSE